MDLTVIAVPGYFTTMGAEYAYLKRQAKSRPPTAGDYERDDTLASLAMGVGSLLAPLTIKKIADQYLTPGKGRYGKALVAGAVGAAAVATIADVVARRQEHERRERTQRECTDRRAESAQPARASGRSRGATPSRSPRR